MFEELVAKIKENYDKGLGEFISSTPLKGSKELLELYFLQQAKCKACVKPDKKCPYYYKKVKVAEDNTLFLGKCDKPWPNDLSPRLKVYKFSSYKPKTESQKEALRRSKEVLKKLNEDSYINLYLWGKNGLGKTHLCSAIFSLAETSKHYVNFTKMIEDFRISFSTYTSISVEVNKLRKTGLLFIDDFGKTTVKSDERNWIEDLLYDIINYRLEHYKPILYTANEAPDKLRLASDIISRLHDNTVIIEVRGQDYRKGE